MFASGISFFYLKWYVCFVDIVCEEEFFTIMNFSYSEIIILFNLSLLFPQKKNAGQQVVKNKASSLIRVADLGLSLLRFRAQFPIACFQTGKRLF
jgi:hypothetical protein